MNDGKIKNGLIYRALCRYDAWWRRRHKVEKFDDLLSFSFTTFSGKPRAMNDGSWIEPGDRLAILHFNRECFVGASADPKHALRNALHFRKLLRASFTRLALDINSNQQFADIKALHGTSWIPPHGEKLGFLIEQAPHSLLSAIQALYFKVLLQVFFPHVAARGKGAVRPHNYWLTRHNLLRYFSAESMENELISDQK
jgi:hypothetical protein